MNSGGSRKTISSAYANISGTRKQIHPYSTTTVYTYTWYRYSYTYQDTTTQGINTTLTEHKGEYLHLKQSDSCPWTSTSSGYKIMWEDDYREYAFAIISNSGTCVASPYVGGNGSPAWGVFLSSSEANQMQKSSSYYCYKPTIFYGSGGLCVKNSYTTTITGVSSGVYYTYSKGYVKGSTYTTVTSNNRNAYPDNGASGSYWYEYKGQS